MFPVFSFDCMIYSMIFHEMITHIFCAVFFRCWVIILPPFQSHQTQAVDHPWFKISRQGLHAEIGEDWWRLVKVGEGWWRLVKRVWYIYIYVYIYSSFATFPEHFDRCCSMLFLGVCQWRTPKCSEFLWFFHWTFDPKDIGGFEEWRIRPPNISTGFKYVWIPSRWSCRFVDEL